MYEINNLLKYIAEGPTDTRVMIACAKDQLSDLVEAVQSNGVLWCGHKYPTPEDIEYYSNMPAVGIVLRTQNSYYFMYCRTHLMPKDLSITFDDLTLAQTFADFEAQDILRMIGGM